MNNFESFTAGGGVSFIDGGKGGHGGGPSGSVILLGPTSDLQAAINNASLGDTLVLPAGASYSGYFYYPVKTGTGYLTITSSGTIPATGTRVSPSTLSQMATIRALAGG